MNNMKIYDNNIIRKSFHILAVILFFPGIITNPPYMVFAFNCVTVLLLLLELSRYFNVIEFLDPFLKKYCDQRES